MKKLLLSLALALASVGAFATKCDLNDDGQIDSLDISAITALRNKPASANPKADVDGNGTINVNDARACVLQCTYKNCATSSPVAAMVAMVAVQAAPMLCDVNGDGSVDKLDLGIISRSRGQTPLPDDPRDTNHDGKLDMADVMVCTKICTRASCALPTP